MSPVLLTNNDLCLRPKCHDAPIRQRLLGRKRSLLPKNEFDFKLIQNAYNVRVIGNQTQKLRRIRSVLYLIIQLPRFLGLVILDV